MPEFDRSTPVTVFLNIHAGTVDIRAEDRTTVLAEVRPGNASDASRQAAENTLVTLDGDTLVVRAPEQSALRFWRTGKLDVTVRVPLDSSLVADTASADVRATGRYRLATVTVASGDIEVGEVTGDAKLDAASGDIAVARVGGSLRAHSASGNLSIGDVAGDVKADAASGDIAIRSAEASAVVETASGDIEVGVLRHGKAKIATASGDVQVGVLAGTGVWLDVSTAAGKTHNDLAMGADVQAPPTGATLELRIRTASGDIAIRRIAPAATPHAA